VVRNGYDYHNLDLEVERVLLLAFGRRLTFDRERRT
jgi:hypothetical protein